MKNIATTVNVSFKYPITEKKLSALIKSGTVEQKYLPHIFSFFTDVPTTDILFFIKKFHIPLLLLKKYYINYLLREKKRKIMIERLDVLSRYGVSSADELDKKIKEGTVAEHPAWEDLTLVENLEAAIAIIDRDIESIQESS